MVAKASPIFKDSTRRRSSVEADTQESDEEFVTVRSAYNLFASSTHGVVSVSK